MTHPKIDSTKTPGTVPLVDIEGLLRTKHAKGPKKDIVLVPTPSNDPDDPLNWSLPRKHLAVACYIAYCFAVGWSNAAIYSVLVPMTEKTGLTLNQLNTGTGFMFLTFGWGCLVWQPLALQYGKRPAFLLSLVLTAAVLVWAPYTTSNGQWIANKCLQGFFGAPIESLVEIAIADVWFTHQRGFYISLYALSFTCASQLAPLVSGYIFTGLTWEWVLYWCAILCMIAFVFCFFFMEETNYVRRTIGVVEFNNEDSPSRTEIEGHIRDKPSEKTADAADARALEINTGENYLSLILSAPPYNFSTSDVGLTYISSLIGTCTAFLITGPLSDWLIIRLTRRNKGIYEPEMRLWTYSVLVVLYPFGLILWGVGAAHHIHWFGPVFAEGLLSITVAMSVTITVSYCIDSYEELSDEMMVTVILVRNTMSFAVSYGITPWVTNMGVQNCFISAAFIGLAASLAFLIFIKWGKDLRQNSASRYWRYVENSRLY